MLILRNKDKEALRQAQGDNNDPNGEEVLQIGIWNLEFGIWNLEFGIWDLGFWSQKKAHFKMNLSNLLYKVNTRRAMHDHLSLQVQLLLRLLHRLDVHDSYEPYPLH